MQTTFDYLRRIGIWVMLALAATPASAQVIREHLGGLRAPIKLLALTRRSAPGLRSR